MLPYLLLNKTVDMSLLRQGMTIPVRLAEPFYDALGFRVNRGQVLPITMVVDGIGYTAQIKNDNFDVKKYPEHSEILQIRYNPTSAIAKAFQQKFSCTWQLVQNYRALNDNTKRLVIPDDRREFRVNHFFRGIDATTL